jgi:thioredoxin reductase (NADPH)
VPDPDPTVHDLVIVGAGPAGLTAGLYASRGRLDTVILERNMAGGQIALTELVENYPGFPEGISGFDLSEKMKAQAKEFGADLREIQAVTSLERDPRAGCWAVLTDQGPVRARSVILAPGREPRRSGIPGEAEFIGRGVSWCATCDGPLYKGRTVAVVGGGDAAVEEGMFLTKFAEKVYLVHRRDELRAAPIAQERCFANSRFELVWDSVPRKIDGTEMVELDESGYIVTDQLLRTNQTGVYACGDAHVNQLKQIVIATGEGALAAVQAEKYLDQLECALPGAESAAGGSAAAPA